MKHITRIVLVGFRGAGKSTIAPLLATQLGWQLIDTDTQIKERTGKTITQLTQDGADWAPFRQIEFEILQIALKQNDSMVLCCAGGIGVNDCIEQTTGQTYGQLEAKLLKTAAGKNAIIVLLEAPIDVLIERILPRDPSHQPTLAPQSKNLEEDNRRAYAIREPLYRALTDYRIDTSKHTPQECADIIVAKVKNTITSTRHAELDSASSKTINDGSRPTSG